MTCVESGGWLCFFFGLLVGQGYEANDSVLSVVNYIDEEMAFLSLIVLEGAQHSERGGWGDFRGIGLF